MNFKRTLLSLAVIAAMGAPPAFANYFSDPASNTRLNIGSAKTPTPSDLQAVGDSSRFVEEDAAAIVPMERLSATEQRALEGQRVYGTHGEYLGLVLTIDRDRALADVQMPRGVAVAIPTSMLEVQGQRVMAPTISHEDMLAMAREQTGRDVSLNEFR